MNAFEGADGSLSSSCRMSRRKMIGGLIALPLLASKSAYAADPDLQVAIIDTPDNAAERVAALSGRKIKAVARYYARKEQDSLPNKIMSSDRNRIKGELEPAVLIHNHISIISAYQYQNNLPQKFLNGLEDTGSRAKEADFDADAALTQAGIVKQPEGSAIYFGVDFNLTEFKENDQGAPLRDAHGEPIKNSDLTDAVLDYFRAIKARVGNHYSLGVYGNGYANRILRKEKLVQYSWISASRSFAETSEFFSNGDWHLFQNQVDRRLFETAGQCPSGFDIDTNIQNPAKDGVGAWGDGEVAKSRNQNIFGQRRFALRDTAVRQAPDPNSSLIVRQRCIFGDDRHWHLIDENQILRNNNVRVMEDGESWVHVDIDDDGVAEGYCLKADLTADFNKMPPW